MLLFEPIAITMCYINVNYHYYIIIELHIVMWEGPLLNLSPSQVPCRGGEWCLVNWNCWISTLLWVLFTLSWTLAVSLNAILHKLIWELGTSERVPKNKNHH